jgi:hypothetical protein
MTTMRRLLQHLPLLALTLTGASFFIPCSEGNSLSIDRAERQSPASVNIQTDAVRPGTTLAIADPKGGNGGKGGGGKGGNGGGGNGGNGGNGGGNGGGGGKGGDLAMSVQPDAWNLNWEHSAGTVSAVIRGAGLDKVDTSTIELEGTDDAAEGLEPVRVQVTRTQIRAFFAKSDALALLDTPERGETHKLTLKLTVDGAEKSLTDKVRIVGDGGGDDGEGEETELEAEIQPDTWNTNYIGSAGTVSVKITGKGLADADLESIVLIGTSADAEPLHALRASRSGNHIRAFFSKSDAFKTLDTPQAGEKHEIIIRLSVDGTETDLKDTIRVVGPGH